MTLLSSYVAFVNSTEFGYFFIGFDILYLLSLLFITVIGILLKFKRMDIFFVLMDISVAMYAFIVFELEYLSFRFIFYTMFILSSSYLSSVVIDLFICAIVLFMAHIYMIVQTVRWLKERFSLLNRR